MLRFLRLLRLALWRAFQHDAFSIAKASAYSSILTFFPSLLVVGSLPAFLGLAVVIPLLGHATWHLYREVIAPDPNPRPLPPRPPLEKRFAADFPAALFSWRRKTDA